MHGENVPGLSNCVAKHPLAVCSRTSLDTSPSLLSTWLSVSFDHKWNDVLLVGGSCSYKIGPDSIASTQDKDIRTLSSPTASLSLILSSHSSTLHIHILINLHIIIRFRSL